MMKSNGLNQLNDNLKKHKAFGLYDDDGFFATFEYNNITNRYESEYGYLTLQGIYEISKDETDKRFVMWKG